MEYLCCHVGFSIRASHEDESLQLSSFMACFETLRAVMGPTSPSKWYYVENSDKHGAFLSRRARTKFCPKEPQPGFKRVATVD